FSPIPMYFYFCFFRRIFTLFFRLLLRRACCSWHLSFRYAPSLPFGLLGVLRFSTCSTALQLSDTPRHLVRLFGFVSVVLRALFTCLFIDLFCEFRCSSKPARSSSEDAALAIFGSALSN